jgi:hypothetical protein
MKRFDRKRMSSIGDKKKNSLFERMSKKIDAARDFIRKENRRTVESDE